MTGRASLIAGEAGLDATGIVPLLIADPLLAADPDAPIDDDAVPFGDRDAASFALLPEWYMPAPGIQRSRGRAAVMLAFAISLVVINIGGFCVTYGFPEFVWN